MRPLKHSWRGCWTEPHCSGGKCIGLLLRGYPQPPLIPLCQRVFLDQIKGHIWTTWRITISPSLAVSVHSQTVVQRHCIWVHMLAELVWDSQWPASSVSITLYRQLHPGSSQVLIYLRNLSTHSSMIPIKVITGRVVPAYQVPLLTPCWKLQESQPVGRFWMSKT